jgi:D-alanyl-D-alanine carboxypeptidase/D-alanyl-D-alanine-endopeptidase (penicillin-binding protein 4)
MKRFPTPVRNTLALCLIALFGCNGSGAGAPAFQQRIKPTLHHLDDGKVRVAARIVELPAGRTLYTDNAETPVTPASNMKLAVTAAALDFFGPDHEFKTWLAIDGDDLWITGSGDPGTSDPSIAGKRIPSRTPMTLLEEWSAALRTKGISRINGKLYYFDGAFDDEQIHPTWAKDDLTHWYAAPISGLNFNDNCIDVTVYPTEDGKPVRYDVVPPASNITVINHCVTGGKEEAQIERAQNENTYTLTGGCTKKTALKSKPVTKPGEFFCAALRTQLAKDGIEIVGPTERSANPLGGSPEPPADKIVAVHITTLRELLPRINKNSQNLIAEGLCKLLGRAYDQQQGRDVPGSWRGGDEAIRAFLAKYDIDAAGLVVADGSGLSRRNRLTTHIISDILVTMRNHPYGQVFFESLSVGGVDGTIAARFKDRPGAVHAKTGFIGGVRSLSGYVPAKDGSIIVFSIIYNGIDGSVKPFEELQDQAVRVMMSWPELDYIPPATTQPMTRRTVQPTSLPRARVAPYLPSAAGTAF